MSVKQPARAEVRDAQGKAKEIARRSTCSGDGRLCKRRARESYSGRSRYRWHGRIVWQKASTHQQGLFSIHSARTKICCPALGSGGLAGVERTRRRAVCGCSKSSRRLLDDFLAANLPEDSKRDEAEQTVELHEPLPVATLSVA